MPYVESKIKGVWVFTPIKHEDNRGYFSEIFRQSEFQAVVGRSFPIMQANRSLSKKGTLRGIHVTTGDVGQAKFISCSSGRIWDVVVDLRLESETFGTWDAFELAPENGVAVFIPEGVGHAFLSLFDDSTANYFCSAEYTPNYELTINPFDENLAIPFHSKAAEVGISEFLLSEKDLAGDPFRGISSRLK